MHVPTTTNGIIGSVALGAGTIACAGNLAYGELVDHAPDPSTSPVREKAVSLVPTVVAGLGVAASSIPGFARGEHAWGSLLLAGGAAIATGGAAGLGASQLLG